MKRRSQSGSPEERNPLVKLGERIRELRETEGLKQGQLAARCQIHPNALYLIETGQRNVTAKNLLRIAAGLKVLPSTLFETFTKADMRRVLEYYGSDDE